MRLSDALRYILLNSFWFDLLGKRSYAQAGEDMIVNAIFGPKFVGHYLDVGAYHPKQFSNTYYFYRKGWSGVAIEPNEKLAALYKEQRPKDRIETVGIGKPGTATYYVFSEETRNTFSEAMAKEYQKEGHRLVKKEEKQLVSLSKFLDEKVDLLSIDVEGGDKLVVEELEKSKYRPRVVIVEDKTLVTKMEKMGYELVGMTPYSLIFEKH